MTDPQVKYRLRKTSIIRTPNLLSGFNHFEMENV